MGKPSQRPQRQALNQLKLRRRKAARRLRRDQAGAGLVKPPAATLSNARCEWADPAEETEARRQAVDGQITVFRAALPVLLKRLNQIQDPRNAKTIKHKASVVLLYGLLTFVFQMASRREANRQMSMPLFLENLKRIFPELESLPHHDTLNRLLSKIEPEQIQQALLDLARQFIRSKKFYRYLIGNCYPIAIDGSQKFVRQTLWAAECLEREVGSPDEDGTKQTQYYVYVLEASLAFANGMTIPLMSEFLSYEKGDPRANKQDCELRAFHRLAERIKECFPCLKILVLLDGLYPNGPVIERCRRYHWDFMMVLQDGSLPSVWEEVHGLEQIERQNRFEQNWGDRRQRFHWVNGIEYGYGENSRKRQILHVVICEESWKEVDAASARIVEKTSRHAWLSAQPLARQNVHERCNLGARHRWGIESSFLVEKRHGYQYEHSFSSDWKAMKGYHYLMRLGHFINVLVQHSARLARLVGVLGLRGLLQFLRDTCAAPWLDAERIQRLLRSPGQLRLE
jgi:hypothetical protein